MTAAQKREGKSIQEERANLLSAKSDFFIREGKRDLWYHFGHAEGGQASQLYKYAAVLRCEYLEDGMYLLATSDKKAQGMFAAYLCDKPEGIDD